MTPAKTALTFLLILSIGVTKVNAMSSPDKRTDVEQRKVKCLEYDSNSKIFTLTCSFEWKETFGDNSDDAFISLQAGEKFVGNDDYIIDLTGITAFLGMFSVSASSFDEAPIISNVHVRNGGLNNYAGYILRKEQKFAVIKNCCSTGDISGKMAGGIVGSHAGSEGNVVIENCSSTGDIIATQAGGIAGGKVGYKGASKISRSFSTGKIAGLYAGGITGGDSGYSGRNQITKCYSLGEISGNSAGGIVGESAALVSGIASVDNSFSRGDITGSYAGGITGKRAGRINGEVSLTNTYASGTIAQSNDAGGLFGSVMNSGGSVKVFNSVYSSPGEIAGVGASNIDEETGVSDDLTSITGKLYQDWENDVWTIGADSLPMLKNIKHDCVDSDTGTAAAPSASVTATPSVTPSVTQTATQSPSVSSTNTASMTCTSSVTSTPSNTASPSSSESPTATSTPSVTGTKTPTTSVTGTSTASSSMSSSVTPSASPSNDIGRLSIGTPEEGKDNLSLSVVLPVVFIICVLLCVVFLFLRSRRNRPIQENPRHACASQLDLPKKSIALFSEWNRDSEVNVSHVGVTEPTDSDGSGRTKGSPLIVLIPPDEFHSVSVRSVSGSDPKSILRLEANTSNAPVFVTFSTVLEGDEIPLQNRVKLLCRKARAYIRGDPSPLVVVNLHSGPSGIQLEGS